MLTVGRKKRSAQDLDLYVGSHRSFEWYWDANGQMSGLDAYESLNPTARAGVLAAFEHWGTTPHGERPLQSRVNEEHAKPLILAAKAGDHRFLAFHAGDDVWVVTGYYKKQGSKLDKIGKREVQRAIAALADYELRVMQGKYYERT